MGVYLNISNLIAVCSDTVIYTGLSPFRALLALCGEKPTCLPGRNLSTCSIGCVHVCTGMVHAPPPSSNMVRSRITNCFLYGRLNSSKIAMDLGGFWRVSFLKNTSGKSAPNKGSGFCRVTIAIVAQMRICVVQQKPGLWQPN